MKFETAKRLVEAGTGLGLDLTLQEAYGGRGMRDRTTAAVTCAGVAGLVQAAAAAAASLAFKDGEGGVNDTTAAAFVADLGNLRLDNMGRGLVAY